ncbi:MAG: DNA-binding protein [Methylacidiphilales bacterium]|nr:DNA-binding protein [Candidatus Methylacidiphilales bacterium]MDW8350098.1 DNA-binding protein [Verrucomicrobiae bacterium]
MDQTIHSEKLVVERKTFFFDLKQNERGQFLRITEDVRGRRDTIIVPVTGLGDFRAIIDRMMVTSGAPEPGNSI